MRFWISVFIGCGMLLVIPAMANVIASLKAEVMLGSAGVKLADIADIEVDDVNGKAELVKSLSAIEIGKSPLPGYSSHYSRKEVERIVRASGLARDLGWRGSDVVRVERLAKVFDTARLVEAAQIHLLGILNNGRNRVEVELAERLPELMLADGKVDIKPRAMTYADAIHARVTVWLDISVAGGVVRSVRVPMNVKVFDKTLVARRDLPKDIVPACDDMVIQEAELASLDGGALPADCRAVKGNLKRAIRAGAVLTRNDIQVMPAVGHGDTVNLLLATGAFVVESRAKALADGEVGQRIKVKPVAGTDTVVAKVMAPGVVQMMGN